MPGVRGLTGVEKFLRVNFIRNRKMLEVNTLRDQDFSKCSPLASKHRTNGVISLILYCRVNTINEILGDRHRFDVVQLVALKRIGWVLSGLEFPQGPNRMPHFVDDTFQSRKFLE